MTCRSGDPPFVQVMKGKVVMQWQHQEPRSITMDEEERIDALARRFVVRGLMICAASSAGAWLMSLLGA